MKKPATSRSSSSPRVAILGCGYWGKNLIRNFHELGALAAICDTSAEALKPFRELYPRCQFSTSVDQVLQDEQYQAVVIATPAETHARLVEQALTNGKDVFVEKPLSLLTSEGKSLVDLARAKKKILMVGHLLWYHPAVLELKELIDRGELGRIQYIYSNRLNLGKIRHEENILWSFAPHDISVILGLVGEMPSSIIAQGGNYLREQIADVTMSALAFPSGVKAHVFVSWLHPFKEQKLVVVGDRQMAVFDDTELENKLILYPHSIEWKRHQPVPNKGEAKPVAIPRTEPLREECAHFLDCLRTRENPRTDGAEALRVLEVLEKCQKALGSSSAPSAVSRSFFAHDSAFIDEDVSIGEGTSIWHVSHVLKGSRVGRQCRIGQNVVIGPRAQVGDHVKIQNNVSVYEGVELESHVFCGPSMVFTNVINPRSDIPRMNELKRTLVKHGATLGANCTIICGHTIGAHAFVGAGAVVTRDVPDYALVLGNPARQVGWMCRCGTRLSQRGRDFRCPSCGDLYQLRNKTLSPRRPHA